MNKGVTILQIAIFTAWLSVVCFALFVFAPKLYKINDKEPLFGNKSGLTASSLDSIDIPNHEAISAPALPVVSHIQTPSIVKAVYMSSWVAGSAKYRDRIIALADNTEINSIVIDVKDSTGRISFPVSDESITKLGAVENRVKSGTDLTSLLHSKGIYVIGRIAVFQDPYLANKMPQWAITRKSDGKVWKDRKGLSFLDPTKEEVWHYTVSLAKEAYKQGFDEINFDYIRYPSDGNLKDINYHLKDGKTRADNIEEFFKYISTEIKKEDNIITSADVFGLTTEVAKGDDMGIGQVWERALPHFDYIAPMIYPSHYPSEQAGFKNPAEHPYEIISLALKGAINKTKLAGGDTAKIRPWLQDFDLGAKYTKELVTAQIKAQNDLGLYSFMLWDPKNEYTREALQHEPVNIEIAH